MLAWYHRRYLDLLGSIYLYNEHRGYTAIDRVIEAVLLRGDADGEWLSSLHKHRADERKHYEMFRRWFQRRGCMPFALDRSFGHIDRFIEIVFRSPINALDTQRIVADDALFDRLCRVIALTERRGFRQVGILLRHPVVRLDPALIKIFTIIERDEPSHWAPYEGWLAKRGQIRSNWLQRRIDDFIHAELLFLKLPLLFLAPRLKRLTDWPDRFDAPAPI